MTRRTQRRSIAVMTVTVLVLIAVIPPDRGPFVREAYEGWAALSLPDARPVHEVLLLGDAGAPQRDPLEPTLRLVQRRMLDAQGRATVVFLGDNVYPRGIPPPDDPDFDGAIERLMVQLEAMRGLPGRVLFVPGNHDWNEGGPDGAQYVARQAAVVAGVLGREAYPISPGQPGPAVIRLGSALTLIAIDTGWYLYEPADERAGREAVEAGFAQALRDTLAAHADEHLVVVGHHPLYSNGHHSGRYPPRSHLYPLIELRDWAFVPLPGLGSLAFEYVERYGLSSQDLGHARYRALRRTLLKAFAPHPNLIYAAGHEHNLQYFPVVDEGQRLHAIVSGAGAAVKAEELVPGYGMAYGYAHAGLAHLRFYPDGAAYLDFVIPKNDGNDAEVVFRSRIR